MNAIFVENESLHWLGTEEGLFRFDASNGDCQYYRRSQKQADASPHKQVYSVFKDSRGKLWVGMARGLYLLNIENQTLEQVGGVPSVVTSFIGEDRFGQLYVAAGNKLYSLRTCHQQIFVVDGQG